MSTPKHVPFASIYRPGFEVVEERQGKVARYPHTEQLPLLLRALNLEFYAPLPGHIARTDRRGDGYHKCALKTAATFFCAIFNRARPDGLRLFALADADLVARVTLVQQVTETSPLGRVHRFRFYGSNGFFPDIHISGKRVAFADHVLQRFSHRVPNKVGEDLANFLLTFYGCAFVGLKVGQSRAFIVPYFHSVLAFTYTETEEEFFVTTCLTVNEMNSVGIELPPLTFNQHYGKEFTRPRIRNWIPTAHLTDLVNKLQAKVPVTPVEEPDYFKNWKHLAIWMNDSMKISGHGPGSRLCFLDNIPGPMTIEVKPNEKEMVFDELEAYKKVIPKVDWEKVFAENAAKTGETPEEHRRRLK